MAHLWAMLRTGIPSQDGLKFIEIAREFGHQPAWEVIRSADQHPLYPAFIAVVHVAIGSLNLADNDSWRIAAQLVSVVAAVLTLRPLYTISQRLFGQSAAWLTLFFWLVLPVPMSIGHETLSDALAICLSLWALEFALMTRETITPGRTIRTALASAACVSAAYWTRPEGLLTGLSVIAFWSIPALHFRRTTSAANVARFMLPHAVFLATVGLSVVSYQFINGRITDRIIGLSSAHVVTNVTGEASTSDMPRGLPLALRDPSLDFSPKDPQRETRQPGLKSGFWQVLREWSESLGMALAVMSLWGLARTRTRHQPARQLVQLHGLLLIAVLFYQAARRGYLSERHVLMLTLLSLPFAGSGVRLCAMRLSAILRLSPTRRRTIAAIGLMAIFAIGFSEQAKPAHESRKPHVFAGNWLRTHADDHSAVFDTRGWASFEANLRRYDPYHIPQALSDFSTRYWVVEAGELSSDSRRAATLNRILAEGGQLAARFSRKPGRATDNDVLVYRWRRPESWNLPEFRQIAQGGSTDEALRDDNIRPVDTENTTETRRR